MAGFTFRKCLHSRGCPKGEPPVAFFGRAVTIRRMAITDEQPQVYTVSPGLASKARLFFAGAIALFLVALGGFFISLQTRTSQMQLHLRTTLPAIVAAGLVATGYRLARSPREVAFNDRGLSARFRKAEKMLSWDDIAWADVQPQAITGRRVLTIYGTRGEVLLRLPANLDRFDELVAAVRRRLADHPSPRAGAVRWRRSRRNAVGFLVGALLATAGAAWMAWEAYDAPHAAEVRDEALSPSPTSSLLLSLGLLALAGLFLVGAVLGFKGIDIATDPATGKLKVNRIPR